MKIFDQLLAWVLIVLGIIHSAFAFIPFRGLSMGVLWFFAAGIAIIEAGGLNILRSRGRAAGLRTLCIVANGSLLFVAVVAGISVWHVLRANPQIPVLVTALSGELALTLHSK